MTDFQTYELTIGDGHSPDKDARVVINTSWAFKGEDMDERLKRLVAVFLPDYEREIENAWTDDTADGKGVWMCIDTGPWNETDPYGGPWMVAELRKVEAKAETFPAREDEQLDFARILVEAA
mgnify:CR=1 FL=1